MGTIAENLLALQETKQNFKTSFESKGVDLTDVPFTEYPNKLDELKEDLETELTEQEALLNGLEEDVNALSDKPKGIMQQMIDATNSCEHLFYSYTGYNLDFIKGLDTSNATSFNKMFSGCVNLTSLDLRWLKTSNAGSMWQMFNSCSALTTLDLSNFNTNKVTDMRSMFTYCEKIKTLDLSSFNTSKVTQASSMFSYCEELEDIIGILDVINNATFYSMFYNCFVLKNVTLKNIKKSISMGSGTSYGTLLTNESLINTIQQLWDLTSSSSQTLTLSTTSKENIANIYVKLIDVTDEMRAEDEYIDNKKPCVVCESTDEGAMTLTEYAISKNWAIA